MKLSLQDFKQWKNKRITLLGMSGVGKSFLSNILMRENWFHYSIDYRIGTRHLDEAILDNIKHQAMQVSFLRDLLRSDSIYICNNITVDHLKPVSSFLGKIGNPEKGGLPLTEFKRRQELHKEAEIKALLEVPQFIRKAQEIYGYQHFINDAGGSLCELDNPEVEKILSDNTLLLYIRASKDNEAELLERALCDPKPLYYREAFLQQQLEIYLNENNLDYVALVDPDKFVRWIFPRLFKSRIPRYESLAQRYGYTISSDDLKTVNDERSFLQLLEKTISEQQ